MAAIGFRFDTFAQSPVIISQPVIQNVLAGGNATFSVVASGVGPLSYQWRLNGTNLPNIIRTVVAMARMASPVMGWPSHECKPFWPCLRGFG